MSDSVVQKPKRYRAPRKIPYFSLVPTTGEVKELDTNWYLNVNIPGNPQGESFLVSPYVDLIPLSYVTRRDITIQKDFEVKRHVYRSRDLKINLKDGVLGRIVYDRSLSDNPTGLIALINSFLYDDKPLSILDLNQTYRSRNMSSDFIEYGTSSRYYARTWKSRVGELMFLSSVGGRWQTEGDYKVVVMPVVLPENYLYHRLRMLEGKPLDLSKIILLIDREIQGTSYAHKNVRAAYHKHIRPQIERLGCQSYYVPLSYIEDMCFIRPYQLKSKGFRAMREEKEQYVKEFLNKLKNDVVSPAEAIARGHTGFSGVDGPPEYIVGVDPIATTDSTYTINFRHPDFVTPDGTMVYTNSSDTPTVVWDSVPQENNVDLQNGEGE